MKCRYLLGRYFVPIKDYSMGTNDNTIHASASMAQGLIHVLHVGDPGSIPGGGSPYPQFLSLFLQAR